MRLPTRKKELERQQTEEPDLHFTPEKIEAMKCELERLTNTERGVAAAEVVRTGEMGDFSENAGYQWAKQNLRRVNGRILSLTEKINHAIPIIHEEGSTKIRIGSIVTVKLEPCAADPLQLPLRKGEGHSQKFTILGSQESDPIKGKISHHSPIGKALLGATVGEGVDVKVGDRLTKYTVLSIA